MQQATLAGQGRAELERFHQHFAAFLDIARIAGDADPIGVGIHLGRGELGACAKTSTPSGETGSGSACSCSPAPVASQRPGVTCAGTSAPSSAASTNNKSTSPSPEAAVARRKRRRRVRGAPAQARGYRDALVDLQPQRRRVPAGGARGTARALAPPGSRRPLPRAHDFVVLGGRATRLATTSSSASEIDCMTLASSWRPSGAGRTDEQAQVDLRRSQRV